MPYLPVDTDIRVVVGPLVDDTDFKSVETGVAYNATGMSTGVDLLLKGVATTSKTDITPADTGDNEWDELGNGYYFLQITDLQNTTEGTLQVVGQGVSGILPFESPVYTVVPIKVYNSLVGGTDNLEVDTIQVGGTTQTAGDVPALVTTVDTVVDSILADTGTDGVVVNTFTTPGKAEINAECDTALTDYDAATGTELAAVDTKIDTIDTNVDSVLADTGTDGVVVNTFTTAGKAEIEAEVTDAIEADGLDHLVAASVSGTDIADNSIIAKLASKSATADWDSYVNTTDSLEAASDQVGALNDVAATDIVSTGAITTSGGAVSSVTTVTGNVDGNVGGNVTGSVGSVATGGITADSIADTAKTFAKNVTGGWSVSAYMSLASDNKSPATGFGFGGGDPTLTVEISKDGGSFANVTANSGIATETSNGIYTIALSQTETNADRIDMRWYQNDTPVTVNETNISIYTAP